MRIVVSRGEGKGGAAGLSDGISCRGEGWMLGVVGSSRLQSAHPLPITYWTGAHPD